MGPSSHGESSVTGGTGGEHVLDYLANFIENSLDAIVAYDSRGYIVFWNRSAERTFGWASSETLGKSSTDLFWPAYTIQEQDDQRQRKLKLDSGEVVQGEHMMQRKDGSLLWVKHSTHAILEQGSWISGYVAVYRDITERKQAEEQLRTTLESIGDGFIACDADWRFIYVNTPAERILRIKREEVLGVSHWDVFPLTLGTNLEREYRRAASGEIRDFENFYEPWGRWFHNRCFPREGGGISVYFEDITERKQAEEILHRFQLLSEHSRDIILFLRREDGRILEANAAAVQAYGYSYDELLTLTIKDLRARHTQSLIAEQFALADANGILFETVHQRKDGSMFPVEVNSRGATIGGVRTLVHIVRDITERKRTEEQLERSNRRLNEILASIQDDFYVLDRDWKFIFTSRSFTSRIGKEPKDFIGNNIWEMFPKHVGGVLYENFHIAMEKREVRRFEIPGKYTDAWYRMTAFPSAEGITVLGTDITDQRRMEREIESMARFPQENPNPVLRIHRDGVISFANAASGSLLRLWNRAVGEPLPESEHKLILQALESYTAIEQEVDCEERVYSLFFTPITNSDYVNIYGHDITERKRAEEALRESEERYRHLVKYAPAGIYEIDIKTSRFIEVNDIMCEILGYTREELLAMMPEDLLDEEGRERFRQRMFQTLAGKKVTEQTEYNVKARDGHEIWVILNTTINYEDGKARSVSVIAHDITERKLAEELLRENKERYATLFNSISEGFAHYKAIYNDAGKLVDILVEDINPAGAELSGVDREAQIGKTWKQVWPGVEDSLFDAYEQVDQTGEALRFDHHSLLTDRIYQISINRIKPGELVATFFDTTEIKQAQKTMARQRELLQRVFENIPVLLVMWDPHLNRFTLNQHAETVLGWTTADANEGDFMSMVYPDPAYRMEVSAYMQSLESGFRELFSTAKNGEPIPIDWANIRLADDTMIGIGVDLRERKRVEKSLRARNEEIEVLLQVSPIAFFVSYDPECRRITANPAGYRLVKLPQELNRNISKSAPVEEQPPYRVLRDGVELASQDLPMQKAARLGMDVVEEALELRFQDGSSKYIYCYARPLMDENGKPRGAIAGMLDITERKQAEEQLQVAQKTLETVVKHMPASVALIRGSDLRLQLINPAYQAIAPGQEMLGHTLDELWPETGQNFTAICRHVLETGEPYQVVDELNMIRRQPDGPLEPAYFTWSIFRVRLPGDGGWGLLNTSWETTARKEAEEALRKAMQELYAHTNNSPLAIVAFDPDYHITEWSAGAERMFGWRAEEVLNKSITELRWVHEGDAQRVADLSADMLTGRVPSNVHTNRNYRKDGSVIECEWYNSALLDANGKLISVRSQVLDVTERRQAEKKLRASEKRFRNLANTVPAIVWTASPDGNIQFTNDYWYTYTGATPEENAGNWSKFVHPEDLERFGSAWQLSLETGSDYLLETRLCRFDGQYRWFQSRGVPIRDDEGVVVAWYGVTMDIHDRVEALHALRDSQQQLQFLNESLEQKVKEQTAEMRRLTANLTKAEQRERSRIAHILHDDLQQRLYAVKMRLNFLTDAHTVDAAVEKEVVELDKQLAEILLLTRHLTIEMSPPVLRDEGLRQAIEWLAFQMNEKLGMRVEVQAEESFAIGDEGIQVLLFNCVRELLFNIVKHAGVNRATVSLQRSGDQLRIEVWDEGKGFDVAMLLGNNKDNKDGDMGEVKATFGLPTLRHQLSLLGGQMNIESEPGAGTRVFITIPYS